MALGRQIAGTSPVGPSAGQATRDKRPLADFALHVVTFVGPTDDQRRAGHARLSRRATCRRLAGASRPLGRGIEISDAGGISARHRLDVRRYSRPLRFKVAQRPVPKGCIFKANQISACMSRARSANSFPTRPSMEIWRIRVCLTRRFPTRNRAEAN